MFLPDRYIKGECPKCGAKDQYGDNCEVCGAVYAPTDLKNPYSALSGATPVLRTSEHYFFKLSTRAASTSCALDAGRPAAARGANKCSEWLGAPTEKGLGDWDISRDAPYFGIEIPDAPGKYFYVWLDAPIGYLASLKNYFAQRPGATSTSSSPTRQVEQIHFIGKDIVYFHTLFWPAMLKFSRPQGADNVYVHGFITVSGEKMSKSRGTGISPLRYLELGLNPEWLRYYIAAKLNGPRRGHRLQSRRLRRARQQRPGRQVRQHRQPRAGFLASASTAAAGRRGRPSRAARCSTGCARRGDIARCTRSASSARRCAR
jgi:methionyl-tRNA synthetase